MPYPAVCEAIALHSWVCATILATTKICRRRIAHLFGQGPRSSSSSSSSAAPLVPAGRFRASPRFSRSASGRRCTVVAFATLCPEGPAAGLATPMSCTAHSRSVTDSNAMNFLRTLPLYN